MTSSSESTHSPTTDSAPPSSGSSTVTGSSNPKGLTSSSQCRVNSSNFFGSPESEGRCCCTNCSMEPKVTTPDVREAPNSPDIISPIATLKHVIPSEQTPPAKRARVEGGDEASKISTKNKKKKFSSILKGMMTPTVKSVDIDQERDALRRGLGGGNFEKVAKI